ncbi:PH domain-containing protein [Ornithinimicrobium faecis]|uniref:PH domain-containing protein n=1 Tax=Ornithinimicrobium faecis TaxID=2934158 RepID=A0ABY4YRT6_9MICO|nr:PH domain-containing protein [Ornithinimicrobium sp. HY1793]USQ79483.1 PH domain-containing protein [Ornithinimicrobium sp. HY1793]
MTVPSDTPPSGPAYDLPAPQAVRDQEWHRQSPRMLLVHPVRVLWSMAVPIVIAFIGISRSDGGWSVRLLPVLVILALAAGVIPWFTTHYRFTDTQLQVRKGLLNKSEKTAPLDRVRSVDLESPPLHRVLSLSRAKIGTGVDESRVELDGLATADAAQLREYLLLRGAQGRSPSPAGPTEPGMPQAGPQGAASQSVGPVGLPQEQLLAEIDWSWLRFAPFSLSSLVIVATALGVLFQFGDDFGVLSQDRVTGTYEWVLAQAIIAIVLVGLIVLIVGWLVVSTLNYVIQWWNLRLVRESGGTIRLTRGLLTTTSTTVEEARIRGVQLTEPLLLRAVGGGELSSLATGVGSGGTTKLLPPCPRPVAESVGHSVLGTGEHLVDPTGADDQDAGTGGDGTLDGPLTVGVRSHGDAAHRRLLFQSLWPTLTLTAIVGGLTWWLAWPWWIVGAVFGGTGLLSLLSAELSFRNLGHRLTPEHVVSRSGAFQRQRVVLERAGIIGWVVHQSFFQRRRGLADLLATTAAGPEVVRVSNIPLPWAIELASQTTPNVVDQFRSAREEA